MGPDEDKDAPRYMQGLCLTRNTGSGNEDFNRYGYPLSIIPVLDMYSKETIMIDHL